MAAAVEQLPVSESQCRVAVTTAVQLLRGRVVADDGAVLEFELPKGGLWSTGGELFYRGRAVITGGGPRSSKVDLEVRITKKSARYYQRGAGITLLILLGLSIFIAPLVLLMVAYLSYQYHRTFVVWPRELAGQLGGHVRSQCAANTDQGGTSPGATESSPDQTALAASEGSPEAASELPAESAAAGDPAARMRTLQRLLDDGLIDAEEFSAKREQILHEI